MSEPKIDLRHTLNKNEVHWNKAQKLHDHSEIWAALAQPFAWFIFFLIALIIIIPYLLILLEILVTRQSQLEAIMRWSTTILAPIVGFGSGVVGYYFGVSGSNKE